MAGVSISTAASRNRQAVTAPRRTRLWGLFGVVVSNLASKTFTCVSFHGLWVSQLGPGWRYGWTTGCARFLCGDAGDRKMHTALPAFMSADTNLSEPISLVSLLRVSPPRE